MPTRPDDTSATSWQLQREVIERMDPAERVRIAIDLSESVRELQIQGILAHNPSWSRSNAVSLLIGRMMRRGGAEGEPLRFPGDGHTCSGRFRLAKSAAPRPPRVPHMYTYMAVHTWLRAQVEAAGDGNYQTLINATLREHIEQQRESL